MNSTNTTRDVDRSPSLDATENWVWSCRLDHHNRDPWPKRFAQSLSDNELCRARRLRGKEASRRAVLAHGIKREILASILNVSPESLQFTRSSHGKPRLVQPSGSPPIYFNLSHSADRMLMAVSSSYPIGVDLELVQSLPDLDSMLERCLGDEEAAEFRTRVPPERRLEGFYRVWTRKEALLKAVGLGLSAGLRNVTVMVHPDSASQPQEGHVDLPGRDQEKGWIWDLPLSNGYSGTVAGLGPPPCSLRCSRWKPSLTCESGSLPACNRLST